MELFLGLLLVATLSPADGGLLSHSFRSGIGHGNAHQSSSESSSSNHHHEESSESHVEENHDFSENHEEIDHFKDSAAFAFNGLHGGHNLRGTHGFQNGNRLQKSNHQSSKKHEASHEEQYEEEHVEDYKSQELGVQGKILGVKGFVSGFQPGSPDEFEQLKSLPVINQRGSSINPPNRFAHREPQGFSNKNPFWSSENSGRSAASLSISPFDSEPNRNDFSGVSRSSSPWASQSSRSIHGPINAPLQPIRRSESFPSPINNRFSDFSNNADWGVAKSVNSDIDDNIGYNGIIEQPFRPRLSQNSFVGRNTFNSPRIPEIGNAGRISNPAVSPLTTGSSVLLREPSPFPSAREGPIDPISGNIGNPPFALQSPRPGQPRNLPDGLRNTVPSHPVIPKLSEPISIVPRNTEPFSSFFKSSRENFPEQAGGISSPPSFINVPSLPSKSPSGPQTIPKVSENGILNPRSQIPSSITKPNPDIENLIARNPSSLKPSLIITQNRSIGPIPNNIANISQISNDALKIPKISSILAQPVLPIPQDIVLSPAPLRDVPSSPPVNPIVDVRNSLNPQAGVPQNRNVEPIPSNTPVSDIPRSPSQHHNLSQTVSKDALLDNPKSPFIKPNVNIVDAVSSNPLDSKPIAVISPNISAESIPYGNFVSSKVTHSVPLIPLNSNNIPQLNSPISQDNLLNPVLQGGIPVGKELPSQNTNIPLPIPANSKQVLLNPAPLLDNLKSADIKPNSQIMNSKPLNLDSLPVFSQNRSAESNPSNTANSSQMLNDASKIPHINTSIPQSISPIRRDVLVIPGAQSDATTSGLIKPVAVVPNSLKTLADIPQNRIIDQIPTNIAIANLDSNVAPKPLSIIANLPQQIPPIPNDVSLIPGAPSSVPNSLKPALELPGPIPRNPFILEPSGNISRIISREPVPNNLTANSQISKIAPELPPASNSSAQSNLPIPKDPLVRPASRADIPNNNDVSPGSEIRNTIPLNPSNVIPSSVIPQIQIAEPLPINVAISASGVPSFIGAPNPASISDQLPQNLLPVLKGDPLAPKQPIIIANSSIDNPVAESLNTLPRNPLNLKPSAEIPQNKNLEPIAVSAQIPNNAPKLPSLNSYSAQPISPIPKDVLLGPGPQVDIPSSQLINPIKELPNPIPNSPLIPSVNITPKVSVLSVPDNVAASSQVATESIILPSLNANLARPNDPLSNPAPLIALTKSQIPDNLNASREYPLNSVPSSEVPSANVITPILSKSENVNSPSSPILRPNEPQNVINKVEIKSAPIVSNPKEPATPLLSSSIISPNPSLEGPPPLPQFAPVSVSKSIMEPSLAVIPPVSANQALTPKDTLSSSIVQVKPVLLNSSYPNVDLKSENLTRYPDIPVLPSSPVVVPEPNLLKLTTAKLPQSKPISSGISKVPSSSSPPVEVFQPIGSILSLHNNSFNNLHQQSDLIPAPSSPSLLPDPQNNGILGLPVPINPSNDTLNVPNIVQIPQEGALLLTKNLTAKPSSLRPLGENVPNSLPSLEASSIVIPNGPLIQPAVVVGITIAPGNDSGFLQPNNSRSPIELLLSSSKNGSQPTAASLSLPPKKSPGGFVPSIALSPEVSANVTVGGPSALEVSSSPLLKLDKSVDSEDSDESAEDPDEIGRAPAHGKDLVGLLSKIRPELSPMGSASSALLNGRQHGSLQANRIEDWLEESRLDSGNESRSWTSYICPNDCYLPRLGYQWISSIPVAVPLQYVFYTLPTMAYNGISSYCNNFIGYM